MEAVPQEGGQSEEALREHTLYRMPLQGRDIPLAPKTGQVSWKGELCVLVGRTEQNEDRVAGSAPGSEHT